MIAFLIGYVLGFLTFLGWIFASMHWEGWRNSIRNRKRSRVEVLEREMEVPLADLIVMAERKALMDWCDDWFKEKAA